MWEGGELGCGMCDGFLKASGALVTVCGKFVGCQVFVDKSCRRDEACGERDRKAVFEFMCLEKVATFKRGGSCILEFM